MADQTVIEALVALHDRWANVQDHANVLHKGLIEEFEAAPKEEAQIALARVDDQTRDRQPAFRESMVQAAALNRFELLRAEKELQDPQERASHYSKNLEYMLTRLNPGELKEYTDRIRKAGIPITG
jgi:hypothetical protein